MIPARNDFWEGTHSNHDSQLINNEESDLLLKPLVTRDS
ncbi:hypothetical protein KP509_36G041800 [Ceratopteris richardii]|uniref:Uncharacterized protein n=1 Tax=Ceratopteris richardii TaxID=49495 RepID=A0A8T2QCJ2_CERRI|nr:hypothetical protein KP509_36G041800 [Ceratopteris richardii]